MIKPITVEAGKRLIVNVQGRFFRCREASDIFDIKIGTDTYTLEGGDEVAVRDTDGDFKQLTFINLSATVPLLVDFFAGKNVVTSQYVKLPRTVMIGHDINLANNASLAFPGVVDGKRRKQFTVTLKPGTASTDRLLVYDDDDDKLLAIISPASSGAGFAIETDANLSITNKTGATVESTSSDPDIAVAETFYR